MAHVHAYTSVCLLDTHSYVCICMPSQEAQQRLRVQETVLEDRNAVIQGRWRWTCVACVCECVGIGVVLCVCVI